MPIRRLDAFALCPPWFPRGAMAEFVLALMALTLAAGCTGPEVYEAAPLPEPVPASRPRPAETRNVFKISPASNTEEVIASGDVLEVTIAVGLTSEDIVTLPSRVNDQGFLVLPEIGPIAVTGSNLAAAEQTIKRAGIVRRLYRDPLVTVIRKTSRTHRVTVLGAVMHAGTYPLPMGYRNVFSAILAAGGLREEAGTEIEVMIPERPLAPHPNSLVPANHWTEAEERITLHSVQIPLKTNPGLEAQNPELPDGAVVIVKSRPAPSVQDLSQARIDPEEDLQLAPGDIQVEKSHLSPFQRFMQWFSWKVGGNGS